MHFFRTFKTLYSENSQTLYHQICKPSFGTKINWKKNKWYSFFHTFKSKSLKSYVYFITRTLFNKDHALTNSMQTCITKICNRPTFVLLVWMFSSRWSFLILLDPCGDAITYLLFSMTPVEGWSVFWTLMIHSTTLPSFGWIKN